MDQSQSADVSDLRPTFVSSSSGTWAACAATTIKPHMNKKMKRNRGRWRGRNDEADTPKCWLARRPWWNASSSAAMLNDSGGAARRQRRGDRHVRGLDRTRERPFNRGWGGGVSSQRSLVPRYLNQNAQRATRSDLLLPPISVQCYNFGVQARRCRHQAALPTPTLEKIARVGQLKRTLNSRAALKFSNASPGSCLCCPSPEMRTHLRAGCGGCDGGNFGLKQELAGASVLPEVLVWGSGLLTSYEKKLVQGQNGGRALIKLFMQQGNLRFFFRTFHFGNCHVG